MQWQTMAESVMGKVKTVVMHGGRIVMHGGRIDRSNARTILYIKKLSSAADGELRRIVRAENVALLRDTAKIRAAKFILYHRG